jgi:hypothetical protein
MPEKPAPRRAIPRGAPPRRSAPLSPTGPPKRTTPLTRTAAIKRGEPIKRKTKPKRRAISPASPAQRAKTKDQLCVVCGARASTPMHLWPRGKGGCDDPLCVLPACWDCHHLYDAKKLDLLRHIVKHHRAEIAHAQLHTDPVSLLARLTASEVVLRSLIPRPQPGGSERQAA